MLSTIRDTIRRIPKGKVATYGDVARAAGFPPSEAVVQALVVDGKRRGAGIGEALMHEAEAWAALRKLASTALYTRIDRDRARMFYERIGYRLKATSHLMVRA